MNKNVNQLVCPYAILNELTNEEAHNCYETIIEFIKVPIYVNDHKLNVINI